MSQWIKTASGHSVQVIGPFLFRVFCIDQNFGPSKFYICGQTKESHYFSGGGAAGDLSTATLGTCAHQQTLS